MATVDYRHKTYDESLTGGFPPGDTRVKVIKFPGVDLQNAAVFFTATPFYNTNENRRLTVSKVEIRSLDPSQSNSPSAVVTVESLGPDTPAIWYLNIGIIEP